VIWSYQSAGPSEPAIARTMLCAFVYSNVTDCLLGLLDLWTCCQYVEPKHRQPTTNFLCTASLDSEGVNCILEEAWILTHVKYCVNCDFICEWKIYGRCFGEFNVDVVIREIHLSHKAGRMESGFYFVVCLLCTFCGRCIFYNWLHFIILDTDIV